MIGVGDLMACQNCRPNGFDQETLDTRIMFFEGGSAARKRTARSEEIVECVDASRCLVKYFLRSIKIVSAGAAREAKLVNSEGILRLTVDALLGGHLFSAQNRYFAPTNPNTNSSGISAANRRIAWKPVQCDGAISPGPHRLISATVRSISSSVDLAR